MAAGSASEIEYHLLLARDLGFLVEKDYGGLVEQTFEVKKMLTGFPQSLRTSGC